MKRCCVIGYGHWGPNVVRNIKMLGNLDLVCLVEPNQVRRQAYIETYGNDLTLLSDISEVKEDIDIVFICSNTETHLEIVEFFLNRDVDIYCEKPFGLDVELARKLFELAKAKNLIIWVNFPYLFHPAISQIDSMLKDQNVKGDEVYSFCAERTNFFGRIMTVDVVRDLMIHDFSILRFLFNSLSFRELHFDVISYSEKQQSHVAFFGRHELGFGTSIIASHHSPVKRRKFEIITSSGAFSFDENTPQSQLQFATHRVVQESEPESKITWSQSQADIYIPHLPFIEPLRKSIDSFADCINRRNSNTELTDLQKKVIAVSMDTVFFTGNLFQEE